MSVIVGRMDGSHLRPIDTRAAALQPAQKKVMNEPVARLSERATNPDQLGLLPHAYWRKQQLRLLERNPSPKHAPTARELRIDAQIAIEFARDGHNGPTLSSSKIIEEAFERIWQTPADMERARLWMDAFDVCKQAGLSTLAATALRGAFEDTKGARDHYWASETPERHLALLREVAREMHALRPQEVDAVVQEANRVSYQTLEQLKELRLNAHLANELGLSQTARQTYVLLHQRAMELDAPHGHLSTRLRSWGEEMWMFYGQPLLHPIINGVGTPHESSK